MTKILATDDDALIRRMLVRILAGAGHEAIKAKDGHANSQRGRGAMDELDLRQETRELLLGTWTAIALITEVLIDGEMVEREDLLRLLGAADQIARDRRRTAIAGIRLLIERGFQ